MNSHDSIKTTLVESITGVWAARHSEELKRGITIKLGYADTLFYKCHKCEPPQCYSTNKVCPHCGSPTDFIRAVSFVDAPGHEALMATMLSGAAVMDGAILVIAADEHCPQPQTREHLAAIEIVGIKNVVIAQNKIDIVDEDKAIESYKEISEFVDGTVAEEAPIIPVSAQRAANIDFIIQALEEHIPTPHRDLKQPPRMHIVRSFDVNIPGTSAKKLKGGVIGGTLLQGKFYVGDEIELSPGIRVKKHKETFYEPLFTEITSLQAGGISVKEAQCGGLVGIGTLLDPSLTKADGLIGNLVGKPGTLPPVNSELTLDIHLFERAMGTRDMIEVQKMSVNERFLFDIGTTVTTGVVTSLVKDIATVRLGRPICVEKGSRAVINRKIAGRWRLIGYGIVIE